MSGGAARRLAGAVVAVLGCLALWASAASAAAPANDHFADRTVLDPGLPAVAAATNVGATREVEEPIHGTLGASGHSVWFEWEATSNGFVTVGTCGSDFRTVTAVYTGTRVDELTKVAGDSRSEGPGCSSSEGREVTFKAIGGTVYKIAIDGDPYYLPPAEPPVGEGAIELQLKATPTPDNDDFSDATALTGSIAEEGTEYSFYWASVSGFNWNADKEAGEPAHAGDPGGASVWYAWTAPSSGAAGASACGSFSLLLGVYVGSSVDTLTSVGAAKSFCPNVSFTASAGTTYWFALDGEFDSGSADAARGRFSVSVSMRLAPRAKEEVTPVDLASLGDTSPPNTTISKLVLRRMPPIWIFRFHSSEPGSTFRCKLDKQRFANCGPSRVFRHLKPGRHTLRAIAVDAAGNLDPTPAVARFSMPKRSRGAPVLMSRSQGLGD